ncbi:MAG: S8 family peptidase [Capnocytophaga sp.]|nr:S8 family peptidase [Capnocytophaga sp.]
MINIRKSAWIVASAIFITGCSPLSKIAKTPLDTIPSNVPSQAAEVSEETLKTWPHANLATDGFPGMNLQGAYDLLKGLKSTNVIVGVIDSGIDINHEDLKEVIWVNPGEIPGNGIDDDNNGYIDDVHGWNFLGNINHENLEFVRILKTNDKMNPEYLTAKEKYDQEYNDAIQNKLYYEQLVKMVETAHPALQKATKKDDYTVEDLMDLQTNDDMIQQYAGFMGQMIAFAGSPDKAKEELGDAIKYFDSKLNYHLNLDYSPREELLGDNPDDINDRVYGDNNVIGPDIDEALHGTHVAGIIGAVRNNGIGMNGVADNITIMALRAVPDGDEYDKDIALAIRYAADNGAKVINTSFGKDFSPHTQWVHDAIKYAAEKDMLIVNAAGNDSKNIDEHEVYPNDEINGKEIADNFLTVGALNYTFDKNLVASFSNFGQRNVDIFSPGVKIWSTAPENSYKFLQGTSMASPEVAGLAALIRSYFPNLTAAQVKKAIMQSGVAPKMKVEVGEDNTEEDFAILSASGKIVNARNAIIIAAQMSKAKK